MQEIGLIKPCLENSYLRACSASFSQGIESLIPHFHPELLLGCVEGQQLQWLVTSFL